MAKNIDLFIEKIMGAVKRRDEKEFNELMSTSGISLHAKNNKGLNAAMYLVSILKDTSENISDCHWLWKQGARLNDFAAGAVLTRNEVLVTTFIALMVGRNIRVDWELLARTAAQVGHKEMMDKSIGEIKKRGKIPNYSYITVQAAFGGQHRLVEELIEECVKHNVKLDFDLLAGYAGWGNQGDYAKQYCARNEQSDGLVDYEFIAGITLRGGSEELALSFMRCSKTPNYITLAEEAAFVGEDNVVNKYVLVARDNNEHPDYETLARKAAEGGFASLAKQYLRSYEGDDVDYDELAAVAARGGHFTIVDEYVDYIMKIQKRFPHFSHIERMGMESGFEDIKDCLKKAAIRGINNWIEEGTQLEFSVLARLYRQNPKVAKELIHRGVKAKVYDYNTLATHAAYEGMNDLADECIDRMRETGRSIQYEQIIAAASRGKHKELAERLLKDFAKSKTIGHSRNVPESHSKAYLNQYKSANQQVNTPPVATSSTAQTSGTLRISKMPKHFF